MIEENIKQTILESLRYNHWEPTKINEDGDIYLLKYLGTSGILFYIYIQIDLKKEMLLYSGQFEEGVDNNSIDSILYLCNYINFVEPTTCLFINEEKKAIFARYTYSLKGVDVCAQVVMGPLFRICGLLETYNSLLKRIKIEKINDKEMIKNMRLQFLNTWKTQKETMNWSITRSKKA